MSKDDATWLNVAYISFLIIVGFVGFKALETVGLQTGWQERYEWYSAVSILGGVVFGIVTSVILRADKERHEYLLASIGELRKVQWPTWSETKRMTIVVCVVCGVFGVIVSIFDVAIAALLKAAIS